MFRTILCIYLTGLSAFVTGSRAQNDLPEGKLLPELEPLVYPLERQNKLPFAQASGAFRAEEMISEWPDYIAARSGSTWKVKDLHSTFSISPMKGQSFYLNQKPSLRWSVEHSRYKADLHFYCIAVFRSGDSLIRCLLPLHGNSHVLSRRGLQLIPKDNGITLGENAIPALSAITPASEVKLKLADGTPVSFHLADAQSVSLRCRIVPVAPDAGDSDGYPYWCEWKTLELASWNLEGDRTWRGRETVTLNIREGSLRDAMHAALSDAYWSLAANHWPSLWRRAIKQLSEPERALFSESKILAGEKLIEQSLHTICQKEAELVLPEIMPPGLNVTLQAEAEETEPGKLAGFKPSVTTVSPLPAPGQKARTRKLDAALILKPAVELLKDIPASTRGRILSALKLKDEAGGIVSIAQVEFTTEMVTQFTMELWLPKFKTHPERSSLGEDSCPVSGICMVRGSAFPRVNYKFVIKARWDDKTTTTMTSTNRASSNQPVVIPVRRPTRF